MHIIPYYSSWPHIYFLNQHKEAIVLAINTTYQPLLADFAGRDWSHEAGQQRLCGDFQRLYLKALACGHYKFWVS